MDEDAPSSQFTHIYNIRVREREEPSQFTLILPINQRNEFSHFWQSPERVQERERERGTFTVHITHRPEKWIPHFWQSHELFYFVLHSYFTFSLSSMILIWDPEKITFELFWCFMLHLIFKIGLDCSLPKRKKEKKLQSSIVLVEDFNELQSNVEKMLVGPFYILNIEWFYILDF